MLCRAWTAKVVKNTLLQDCGELLHNIPPPQDPFMFAHELSQDDVYNSTGPKYMPALNRLLGAGGTRMSNFVVPTGLCCPARTSLLTGKLAHCTNGKWRSTTAVLRGARNVSQKTGR